MRGGRYSVLDLCHRPWIADDGFGRYTQLAEFFAKHL